MNQELLMEQKYSAEHDLADLKGNHYEGKNNNEPITFAHLFLHIKWPSLLRNR
jgi:hypothetical protein